MTTSTPKPAASMTKSATPKDYRLSKPLVVGGRMIEKGTLLSSLRKRGGDWTNRVWVDRLIEAKLLVPFDAAPDP